MRSVWSARAFAGAGLNISSTASISFGYPPAWRMARNESGNGRRDRSSPTKAAFPQGLGLGQRLSETSGTAATSETDQSGVKAGDARPDVGDGEGFPSFSYDVCRAELCRAMIGWGSTFAVDIAWGIMSSFLLGFAAARQVIRSAGRVPERKRP